MSDMDKSHTPPVTQTNAQTKVTTIPDTPKVSSKIKNLTFVIATIGVLPFFICTLGIATHITQTPLLLKITLAYSALLVTFLCGIHWGIAVSKDGKFPKLSRFLIIEGIILVLASLAIYLFVNVSSIQLFVFVGILTFIWLIDLLISFKRMIPLWFLGVRSLVTVLVVGLLIITKFTMH